MGIWDRFGRGSEGSGAATDEQAIARYRYMLRTAPPEAIEAAHAEAFATLTPEQRRKVLDQLKEEMPDAERVTVMRASDSPESLARLATRAEIRQPGAMERIFGGVPAGQVGSAASPGLGMGGFGGMMAGGFLASMAGSVLGSMVAQQFFHSHPEANHLFGGEGRHALGAGDHFADSADGSRFDDLSKGIDHPLHGDSRADDLATGFDDDPGGGFDGGDTFDT